LLRSPVRRRSVAFVLPYPANPFGSCRAAFCFRENAIVRKKPECWNCSWCENGSELIVDDVSDAQNCARDRVTAMLKKTGAAGYPQRRAA